MGEVTSFGIAKIVADGRFAPALIVKSTRGDARLKAFIRNEEAKFPAKDYGAYFQKDPLGREVAILVFRNGKRINSIEIDLNIHLTVVAGIVAVKRIHLIHEDDLATNRNIHFELGELVDVFQANLLPDLLRKVAIRTLRNKGEDLRQTQEVAANLWAFYEAEWAQMVEEGKQNE